MTASGPTPAGACDTPLDPEVLVDYWLGLLTPEAEDHAEQHLFACDACGDRLRQIMDLSDALRTLAQSGGLKVVVGCHGALDAFPSRRGVFAHAETCLRRMLHELIADHHLQRSRSRERAETLGHGDHLAEPVSAPVTGHQVLLNGLFGCGGQGGEPVVH